MRDELADGDVDKDQYTDFNVDDKIRGFCLGSRCRLAQGGVDVHSRPSKRVTAL